MMMKDLNPYESPKQPTESRVPLHAVKKRESLLMRARWIPFGLILGGLFGNVGAWFLWNFIYSIGSSVITDKTYALLESDVYRWGAIVGLVSGAILALVAGSRFILLLLAQHFCGMLFGMIGTQWGWQIGLGAYYAGQVAGISIGLLLLLLLGLSRQGDAGQREVRDVPGVWGEELGDGGTGAAG
jgi:hypothetical protein